MTLAKAFFYQNREVPPLPWHGECRNTTPTKYVGFQHVYALCALCHESWVLLASEDWEPLSKDQMWIGPADHGERE